MAEKDRYRTRQIHIRLDEEEYAILQAKSAEAEMTASDAIRWLIKLGRIYPRQLDDNTQKLVDELHDFYKKSIYEINKIGNNINQIAWNTNGKYQTEKYELKMAYEEVMRLQNLLNEDLNYLGGMVDAYSSYT